MECELAKGHLECYDLLLSGFKFSLILDIDAGQVQYVMLSASLLSFVPIQFHHLKNVVMSHCENKEKRHGS